MTGSRERKKLIVFLRLCLVYYPNRAAGKLARKRKPRFYITDRIVVSLQTFRTTKTRPTADFCEKKTTWRQKEVLVAHNRRRQSLLRITLSNRFRVVEDSVQDL